MKVAERYSVEETKYFRIGAYVAIALIILVVLFLSIKAKSEYSSEGDYYPLKATFGRTDGLLVGDQVRMAGLSIGRVTHAQFDDKFHAILTMEVKADVRIPDDSSASIVSYSLMGPKYIEVEPGGSEDYLQPNDDFSYTQDAIVLEELIGRIVDMGKAARSPKELKKIDEFENSVED